MHAADLATAADERRAETGELRLLGALLWQALDDARKGHADARAWLASDESGRSLTGYFFVDVCAALDVDPTWVRRQVQRGVQPRGGRRRMGRRFVRLEALDAA